MAFTEAKYNTPVITSYDLNQRDPQELPPPYTRTQRERSVPPQSFGPDPAVGDIYR